MFIISLFVVLLPISLDRPTFLYMPLKPSFTKFPITMFGLCANLPIVGMVMLIKSLHINNVPPQS